MAWISNNSETVTVSTIMYFVAALFITSIPDYNRKMIFSEILEKYPDFTISVRVLDVEASCFV
jgi:hypothetical protein